MSREIIVPTLGESITEATVSKWLKNHGESVKIDEPVVELETDKVNVEVPSPAEGVIVKVNLQQYLIGGYKMSFNFRFDILR